VRALTRALIAPTCPAKLPTVQPLADGLGDAATRQRPDVVRVAGTPRASRNSDTFRPQLRCWCRNEDSATYAHSSKLPHGLCRCLSVRFHLRVTADSRGPSSRGIMREKQPRDNRNPAPTARKPLLFSLPGSRVLTKPRDGFVRYLDCLSQDSGGPLHNQPSLTRHVSASHPATASVTVRRPTLTENVYPSAS